MILFPSWHRSALESLGYTVLAPDEPQDEATAVRYLRSLGYGVVKATLHPAPIVGREYRPSRTDAASRWVVSVGRREVTYALTQDGWPVTVSRATWERWVRKTKARVV